MRAIALGLAKHLSGLRYNAASSTRDRFALFTKRESLLGFQTGTKSITQAFTAAYQRGCCKVPSDGYTDGRGNERVLPATIELPTNAARERVDLLTQAPFMLCIGLPCIRLAG